MDEPFELRPFERQMRPYVEAGLTVHVDGVHVEGNRITLSMVTIPPHLYRSTSSSWPVTWTALQIARCVTSIGIGAVTVEPKSNMGG